jgi:prolyl oligopeptidase
MAYSVRRGGADEVEVRIRDLTTGEDLPDVLPAALYGGIEFDADGQSVTYVHRSRVDGPRLKRHVLGTDIATDSILFGDGIAPTAFLSAGLVDDGRWRILSVQRGWAGHDVYVQDARTGALRTVVTDSAAHLSTRWHDGRLWIVTDLGAPRYRLVTADPANPGPENWTVVLPEDDDVLQSHAIIGGRIHATYLHDVSDRIRVFAMDGTPAGEIDVPDHMTASIRPSASAETSSTA